MAHKEQIEWCKEIRDKFPHLFIGSIRVLDVGSLDVSNSYSNKTLFDIEEPGFYLGLDVVGGKNVDVIGIMHKCADPIFEDESFDVVCSVNALEHDMYYPLTLDRMCKLLKSGGLMFMSIGAKWQEHGTLKHFPSFSGTSQLEGEWANYYRNLKVRDIIQSIGLDTIFSDFQIGISGKDLQFWGLKHAT